VVENTLKNKYIFKNLDLDKINNHQTTLEKFHLGRSKALDVL